MHTIAFHSKQKADLDLLIAISNQLGIKQISNPDFEFLTFLNDKSLRIEIAILLFKQEKFTLGKASEFVGLHQYEFQKILAERKIPIHYDKEDLDEDLKMLLDERIENYKKVPEKAKTWKEVKSDINQKYGYEI